MPYVILGLVPGIFNSIKQEPPLRTVQGRRASWQVESGETSRTGQNLRLLQVTPMGLHMLFFTESDPPVGADTNTSGTRTLYKYTNDKGFIIHIIVYLRCSPSWRQYVTRHVGILNGKRASLQKEVCSLMHNKTLKALNKFFANIRIFL